jgi:hypothetical protein
LAKEKHLLSPTLITEQAKKSEIRIERQEVDEHYRWYRITRPDTALEGSTCQALDQ